jgi:hypothetical protein
MEMDEINKKIKRIYYKSSFLYLVKKTHPNSLYNIITGSSIEPKY